MIFTGNAQPQTTVFGNPDDDAAVVQARERWKAGDFDGCIASVDRFALSQQTSESIFLRARALLRLQKDAEAQHWLQMMESRHITGDAQATHAMLLGSACARLNDFDRADALFARARSMEPHATIVVETAYYHALALWQMQKLKAARAAIVPALAVNQDIVSVRARQLLGFIEIAENRPARAQRHFAAALTALDTCQAQDIHLQATLLHQLAIGNAEVELDDPEHLDKLAHAIRWTPNLVTEHVGTLRHLGLAYARRGQTQIAMDRLVEAAYVDKDSAWSILAFGDAATICRQTHETNGETSFLEICRHIADHYIPWESLKGDEHLALLQLATIMGRTGKSGHARAYLDLYEKTRLHMGTTMLPLSALNHDRRLRTIELHAGALVCSGSDPALAVAKLGDVHNEWRKLHYPFRAQEARDDLRHLDPAAWDDAGASATHCATTQYVIPTTPSVYAIQANRTITLTSQQDRVLRKLVRGCSIAQIADALSLEQKTVRNHLTNLYTLFEVTGKAQLIALILRDEYLRHTFAA